MAGNTGPEKQTGQGGIAIVLVNIRLGMPMKVRRQRPANTVSREKIIRAVASSTAIETGEAVAVLEAKLRAGNSKFKHITLAS